MLRQLFLLSFLFVSASLSAFIDEWSVQGGISYRRDQLDWNISGPNGHPNILSELEWKGLDIWQFEGQTDILICQHFYGWAQADYGWIVGGENRDSDYWGPNRTEEFCRSISRADRGHVYDGSMAIGYQFYQDDQSWILTPLIGYSGHAQHLTIINGEVVLQASHSDWIGSIYGLNSSYKAYWYGPWVGIRMGYAPYNECWTVEAGYEYHKVCYGGHGHWNLRVDMPDGFGHHTNDAHGHVWTLMGRYALTEYWFLAAKVAYQTWDASNGIDGSHIVTSNGGHYFVTTRLNHVNWNSYLFGLQIGTSF